MTVLGEILVEHGKEIGKEIGIAEGRTQGIEAFILDNLEENIPRGRIIDKLIRRFSLSREDAERCYRRVLDNAVL